MIFTPRIKNVQVMMDCHLYALSASFAVLAVVWSRQNAPEIVVIILPSNWSAASGAAVVILPVKVHYTLISTSTPKCKCKHPPNVITITDFNDSVYPPKNKIRILKHCKQTFLGQLKHRKALKGYDRTFNILLPFPDNRRSAGRRSTHFRQLLWAILLEMQMAILIV